MEQIMTSVVSRGGRGVVPREIRKTLNLKPGERVMFAQDANGVHLLTLDQAVAKAQAIVEQHIPADIDLQADLRKMRDQDLADEIKHS